MPWARLDDRFHDNRKIRRVWRRQPAAVGLHVMAITYCAGHLTDGVVDVDFVEDMVRDEADRGRLVSVLVDAGLWISLNDEGWAIHDYGKFNPSKDAVETRRRAKSDAGKQGAEARWTKGSMAPAIAPAMAPATAVPVGGNAPDPTRPVPTQQQTALVEPGLDADLFAYWQTKCGHDQAKLTRDRRGKIRARLSEGYTAEQIRSAIDGAAVGAFVGDNGKRHDDIELICRNGSKLESFIGRRANAAVVPINDKYERSARRLAAIDRVTSDRNGEGAA